MNLKKLISHVSATAESYPDKIFKDPGKAYTCINPYSYHIIRKNPQIYYQMDGLFIDGMSMCWWIKWLWGVRIPRLSFDMTAIAKDLFGYINGLSQDKSIFFIGARQHEVEKSVAQIKSSYPNINDIRYRNGYFQSEKERIAVISEIVKVDTDYVIVGMGAPLQDKFALDLMKAGYKGIVFTCGGFLHQTSEDINYYPEWVNNYNLRALYRLFYEKGLVKRLFNVLIEFPILFIKDTIQTKFINRVNSYEKL